MGHIAHKLVKDQPVPLACLRLSLLRLNTEPECDVLTSSGGREELTCLHCSFLEYAECQPCHSHPRIGEANPAGRQTDATVVNIFWPWEQLLRLVGGADKPHRMVQAGLSSSAKPEEDLCYRRANGQRKKNNLAPYPYRLSVRGETLLPAPQFQVAYARLRSEAKTMREEQRDKVQACRSVKDRGRQCLFSVKESLFSW